MSDTVLCLVIELAYNQVVCVSMYNAQKKFVHSAKLAALWTV